MTETDQLIDLLQKKVKLCALLAPSFPIMFEYPMIVARLKALGFHSIVEVTAGAVRTNEAVGKLLTEQPTARFITSPCAGFVRLVRKEYPHLLPFLAFKADSPMIASAKIAKEKYPDCLPVFIGPCIAKKLESTEDYPDLHILVITYRELNIIFQKFGTPETMDATNAAFDIAAPSTRIYPMDGGLTITSGAQMILKEEEIRIVSGWKNIPGALKEFETNKTIRLLDILCCEGGCINGPGTTSTLTLEQRKEKILAFARRES
jgi:iron only hydrogenase large subunit-like protein